MKEPEILIVEDVSMIADYMGLILSRNGYRVSGVVTTGEEAVSTAFKTSPDLVLMDIKIKGGIDGIRAAEIIRDKTGIPVVYVTTHTDRETFSRAMATEPSAYIRKPFKSNELLLTVRKALGRLGGGGGRAVNTLVVDRKSSGHTR